MSDVAAQLRGFARHYRNHHSVDGKEDPREAMEYRAA